jgi:ABC-2 type transport system permease protein
MNGSVVRILILSDWQRHWKQILVSIAAGGVALVLLQVGGEMATIVGATWFFVAMIVLGSMLPMSNVVNERKKQILPFLMSLPVSVTQYTTAKLVSTVGMFLVSWATLLVAAVLFILGPQRIPNGMIPTTIILAAFTFIGFCLIAGVAIVSESEGWTIAATVASNSSYGLAWYLLVRNAAIRETMGGAAVVWSSEVLTVLAGQVATIAVILGLTFYLQSRKRDFV